MTAVAAATAMAARAAAARIAVAAAAQERGGRGGAASAVAAAARDGGGCGGAPTEVAAVARISVAPSWREIDVSGFRSCVNRRQVDLGANGPARRRAPRPASRRVRRRGAAG
jgi:hypothetical protein